MRSERPVIALWCSLLAGSSLKMDGSAPGEGPKRAFSGIKKLRQSRSEAFSSGNYAFFSVLALFLCVLVAKLCVFMAFLSKKNKAPKEPRKRIVMRFSPRKGTIKETGV